MASSRPLQILLFLLLVLSTRSAIPNPAKKSLESKPSNLYIVHTRHLAKPSRFPTLRQWYASMVSTNSTHSSRIVHTYDTVMHGFAADLTDEEARLMSSAHGVSAVHRDRVLHTQTTRSPGFLGLEAASGAWPESEFGDGVIVGFIDSGIWPERASFGDSGLGPVRASWRGECAGDVAGLCNRKLVGARSFVAEQDVSPRDAYGHGTHVAGTAAGAAAPGASFLNFSSGTASGVAPKARIAVYKACFLMFCRSTAIVAAIDAAVKDGVDIISMSLGSDHALPFHDDSLAIALFGAERRGVFVAVAGGNGGPTASTVTNVAPWMTTVGAATMDRLFPATLALGNGEVLTGHSLYTMKTKSTELIKLTFSSCGDDDLTPERIMGKVVVCKDGGGDLSSTSLGVQHAGGAGIVAIDTTERFWDGIMGLAFTLPGLTLSYPDGEKLKAYMASAPHPEASFTFPCETVTGRNRAPMVAGFSSRGPNPIVPEILKPDVIAPGVNVLAPWTGSQLLPENEAKYNIISGTSMACPHVSGAAALVRKKHPTWTPAMVRSALMTSAATLDNTLSAIVDNHPRGASDATPLAAGSGLVRPASAMDPGLVYDAGVRDYVGFLCSLNYTAEQVRLFVPDLADCPARLPAGGAADLNYPSLVVVFDSGNRTRTLTRTVTKVSAQPETYAVTVEAPEGVEVVVTPSTLEFTEQHEKRTYTVEFTSIAGGSVMPRWDFGRIAWTNSEHQVVSPVAFNWKLL